MQRLLKFDNAMGSCEEIGCPKLCSQEKDCVIYDAYNAIASLLIENQALKNAANGFRAKYEEIREVLGDNYDLDHLRKLIESASTGKFISIPCKVGDTVYVLTNKDGCLCCRKEIVECEVNTMRVKSDGFTIGYSCQGRYSNGNRYIGNFVFKSIGKTVFLTRESAESALKGDA